LKCLWCHNPESVSYAPQVAFYREKCIGCGTCKGKRDGETALQCPVFAMIRYGDIMDSDTLVAEISQDLPFFKSSGGGVTLSGGECLSQPDFAVDVAKKCAEKGIRVYVDTCGYVSREVLDRMIPYTDRFLYDVKAIDPAVHRQCTGRDNRRILENLVYLCERGCSVEIRYPLVMGYNDGECERIGAFLQNLKGICKVKVLQYHSFSGSRYEALGMKNTLPDTVTSFEDVERAVSVLKKYDLNAVNGITEA